MSLGSRAMSLKSLSQHELTVGPYFGLTSVFLTFLIQNKDVLFYTQNLTQVSGMERLQFLPINHCQSLVLTTILQYRWYATSERELHVFWLKTRIQNLTSGPNISDQPVSICCISSDRHLILLFDTYLVLQLSW